MRFKNFLDAIHQELQNIGDSLFAHILSTLMVPEQQSHKLIASIKKNKPLLRPAIHRRHSAPELFHRAEEHHAALMRINTQSVMKAKSRPRIEEELELIENKKSLLLAQEEFLKDLQTAKQYQLIPTLPLLLLTVENDASFFGIFEKCWQINSQARHFCLEVAKDFLKHISKIQTSQNQHQEAQIIELKKLCLYLTATLELVELNDLFLKIACFEGTIDEMQQLPALLIRLLENFKVLPRIIDSKIIKDFEQIAARLSNYLHGMVLKEIQANNLIQKISNLYSHAVQWLDSPEIKVKLADLLRSNMLEQLIARKPWQQEILAWLSAHDTNTLQEADLLDATFWQAFYPNESQDQSFNKQANELIDLINPKRTTNTKIINWYYSRESNSGELVIARGTLGSLLGSALKSVLDIVDEEENTFKLLNHIHESHNGLQATFKHTTSNSSVQAQEEYKETIYDANIAGISFFVINIKQLLKKCPAKIQAALNPLINDISDCLTIKRSNSLTAEERQARASFASFNYN